MGYWSKAKPGKVLHPSAGNGNVGSATGSGGALEWGCFTAVMPTPGSNSSPKSLTVARSASAWKTDRQRNETSVTSFVMSLQCSAVPATRASGLALTTVGRSPVWSKCACPKRMSSGLRAANSPGVEPMYRIDGQGGDGRGAPPSRTMYASRKTTWPLKAETKLLTPVHDSMTRSSRTAPVVGLTLSRPKNFWRAAIVPAGRGRDSSAFTGAVTENDKPTIATDNVRLRIFLLLFLVYCGSRSWGRSIAARCSLRPLPRTVLG